MLVAIISDLHEHHWARQPRRHDALLSSLSEREPDVVIDAGDYEDDTVHSVIRERFDVVAVNGNHDYYDARDWTDGNVGRVVRLTGLPPIVAAPLWTDFNKGSADAKTAVREGLADSRWISDYDTDTVHATHAAHVDFIRAACRDNPGAIVVTHHAPSLKSVHPRYVGNPLNWGFVSDLDELVDASKAGLWVHGHVHDPFDYVIGETRVVCNPRGYPGERPLSREYVPTYVEI